MNSKSDNPNSMDRLFSGLMQVNQQRERVPQAAEEETGETVASPEQGQREEEVKTEKPKGKSKPPKGQFLFRVDEELLLKTRQISYRHGMSICDIMNYALGNFITKYEEKYGVIKKKGNKISVDKLL